jgi:methyl-accepting chemotaxis protein
MNLTIRWKLYGLGLLGVFSSLTAGLAGVYGISKIVSRFEDIDAATYAVRPHVEAAMFLDLTRNDLSKVLTSTGNAQENANTELGEHCKLLGERLATAIGKTRDPQIRTAFEAEKKVADDYLLKISKISDGRQNLALVGPMVGPLLQTYQDLRASIDENDDKLEAASKKSGEEARHVVQIAETIILAACLVSLILITLIAINTTRDIERRLANLILNLKKMASGDLTLDVQDARKDELGEIAHWFGDTVEKLRDTIQRVARSAKNVASAVERLAAVSNHIGKNSEQTTLQANIASTATGQVTHNLQTVATGTEEMSASIGEIARNASDAARVAGEAVHVAQSTNGTIGQLGDSSSQIGQVIKIIASIAEQTNLLALNATIEAARAGEAGKGFAVVANEVKELAKQTATATADIGRKVEAIQADSKKSAEAIARVTTIINQINDISTTIATAVEEQSATTSDITRNISDGAKNSGEIASNIASLAQTAENTSEGARELQKASDELAFMSTELKNLVGQFTYEKKGDPDDKNTPIPHDASAWEPQSVAPTSFA